MSGSDALEDRISMLRRRDRRYARNAYYFILDALDYTIERLGRDRATSSEGRHVGGKDVLEGARDLAVEQFGPMATYVFESWGVRRTEDIGEIVFNMIDIELLSRRPEDSRLDFVAAFDFADSFDRQYRERLQAISRPESVV